MRLLAFVVGNTHIKLGVYDGTRLIQHCRVQTDEGRTADEYGVLVRNLLGEETTRLDGAAVASVVPTMTETITELCRKYLKLETLIVGPGVKTGMPILYDKPQDVGADRIVNCIAAYELTHDATIVVDFGTATVFDYLSARGEYIGGVICPGVIISSEALFARAAKLYRVEMAKPKQVIGRNTVNAIQSGIIYGHAALVDGMVERIQAENTVKARVIATGGLSSVIGPETKVIEEVHEYLTLDGERILYERNL